MSGRNSAVRKAEQLFGRDATKGIGVEKSGVWTVFPTLPASQSQLACTHWWGAGPGNSSTANSNDSSCGLDDGA